MVYPPYNPENGPLVQFVSVTPLPIFDRPAPDSTGIRAASIALPLACA